MRASLLRSPACWRTTAGARALVARDAPMLRFAVAPALETNAHLTRLVLVNVGATRDDATTLFTAMQANQRLALRELDLSQNNIEDRGVTALSNWLSKMRDGIVRLRLAECGAGRQGLALLLTTLENHHYHASTVREVDLSHNRAGEETNRSLQSFLRKASVLECLRLANMSMLDVEVCMRAELASSFCLALRTLDLSGNRLPDHIDEMPNFATFLNAAPQLVELSLASTGLSVGTLVELVSRMRALVVLDLSENGSVVDGFRDLTELLRASFTLQQLHLNGVCRVKSKNARDFVLALATLVGSPCPLVDLTLSVDADEAWRARTDALAGSYTAPLVVAAAVPNSSAAAPLRDNLLPLLDHLARNRTLRSLDITGQGIGDAGAFLLAHALRGNRALRSLRLDDNGITFDGFEALAQAMQANESVVMFEYPRRDVAAALELCARAPKGGRVSVETLQTLLRSIQTAAVRNATRPQTAIGIVDLVDDKDFAALCDGAVPLLEKILPAQPVPRVRSQLTSATATVLADAFVRRSRGIISGAVRQEVLALLQDCAFNKETGAFVLRSTGESLMACERCQSASQPVKKINISTDGTYTAFWCASCDARSNKSRRDTELFTPRNGNDDALAMDDSALSGDADTDDATTTSSPSLAASPAVTQQAPVNRSGEWRSAKPSNASNDGTMSPRDDESRVVAGGRRLSPHDHDSSETDEGSTSLSKSRSRLGAQSAAASAAAEHDGTDLAGDDEIRGSASLRAKRRGSKAHLASQSLGKLYVAPPLPDNDGTRNMPPPLPKSPGRPGEDMHGAPPTRPAPTPAKTSQRDASTTNAATSSTSTGGAAAAAAAAADDTTDSDSATAGVAAAVGLTGPVAQKLSTMTREERRKALQEAARARPKRVDKWGFEVDTMKAQRNQSAKEREKEAERAEKWAPMIAEWDRFWNKMRPQTKDRFRKGLPDTLRGPLWRLVTNSDALRDENVGLYARLSRQESPVWGAQIARDLHRTFPKHVYFTDGAGLGQVGLQKILNAFALYDEKTGYTQGMGFVAGLLLIYMGEEDAFFTLVRLMTDYELAGLYSNDFPRLHEMLHVHTQLLKTHLPAVAAHFEALELESKTYGFQWFSTLYLYALPFHLVIRIWDYFLVDRFVAVYSIALALLKLHQQRLLQLDWEGVMKLLFAFNELELDASLLITTALEFKLKEEQLQKHALVYHKQLNEAKQEEEEARRHEELQKLVTETSNATPTLSTDEPAAAEVGNNGTATTTTEDIDFDDDDDGDDDDSPLPPPSDEPPLSASTTAAATTPKSPSRRSGSGSGSAKQRSKHHHKSRSSTPAKSKGDKD
jgi:Ran GTPase-activating protein (RanGAP) involved in mRNA processing and transport